VAALVFIAVENVAWGPATLIAAGSIVGAQLAPATAGGYRPGRCRR
jgi:hypothetical protein